MRQACLLLLIVLPVACDRPAERPATRPDTANRATAALAPRFEDYAVTDTAFGRRQPAPVQFASADYGQMYRTKLGEGAATGPNFAGHFTVVTWGCGTGCQIAAIVDARTGQLSNRTLLTA